MKLLDICKEVQRSKGTSYYVGGYVRNGLIAEIHKQFYSNKDIDIELHNIEPETFESILEANSVPYDKVGKSFGVYKVLTENEGWIDFSFPRTERNTGNKHTDFEVSIDPYLGTTNAIRRRDITINGIMQNVLTGEYIDPFGGIQDIKNKLIRAIDKNTFQEDALRVLRVCNFATRFGFEVEAETLHLMKTMELCHLPKERIFEEYVKSYKNGNIIEFHKMLEQYSLLFQNKNYKAEIEILSKKSTLEHTLANLMNPKFLESYIVYGKKSNMLIEFYSTIKKASSQEVLWEMYKLKRYIPEISSELMKTEFDIKKIEYFNKAVQKMPTGQELMEKGYTGIAIKEAKEAFLKEYFSKFSV